MKKISVICLSGLLLFFTACESNSNSSTVGKYENDDVSQSSDNKEGHSQEQSSNTETGNASAVTMDTAKNITGVTRDSVSPHTKKDSGTVADKINVKVQKTKKIEKKP